MLRHLIALTLLSTSLLANLKEDYLLGPDSQIKEGVPQGQVQDFTWKSKVFENTLRR